MLYEPLESSSAEVPLFLSLEHLQATSALSIESISSSYYFPFLQDIRKQMVGKRKRKTCEALIVGNWTLNKENLQLLFLWYGVVVVQILYFQEIFGFISRY